MSKLTRKDMHDYQVDAYGKILNGRRSLLLADMGCGKSIITLTAIADMMDVYKTNGKRLKVLIVAPPSVTNNVWEQEAELWEHTRHIKVVPLVGTAEQRARKMEIDADINVVSFNNLKKWSLDLQKKLAEEKATEFPYQWVVVDESGMLRTPSSQRTRLVNKLCAYVPRITLLTATPVPKSEYNLFSQIKILDGGKRLGKTQQQFRERYFTVTTHDGVETINIRDAECRQKLIERIADISFRYDAKDHLPSKGVINNTVWCSLSNSARMLYDEFFEEFIAWLEETSVIDAVNSGVRFGRLHQIANGTVKDTEGNVRIVHSGKLDRLLDTIDALAPRNVLVAYTHVGDRDRILDVVEGSVHFKGSSKKKLKRWNENPDSGLVYVASPASMGHGLNMQKGGSDIICYGIPTNSDEYTQMIGRVNRQGQQRAVSVHHIMTRGTVDEQIYNTILRRGESQQHLLDEIKRLNNVVVPFDRKLRK